MGSGGSRYGAGRPSHKAKTGDIKSIDVRRFAKLGYLDSVNAFSWEWSRNGEPNGSIAIHVEPKSHITLRYTVTTYEQKQTRADRVYLSYTHCHYGNSRPWLLCPKCNRRFAKLFMRWGFFACRHCQKVAYSSQSDDAMSRTWRIQRRIESAIGEKWERPKGMRWKTFEGLMGDLTHCIQERDVAFGVSVQKLMASLKSIDLKTTLALKK